MKCPDNAVQFVADWWELSGNIITTVAAFQRLREVYPQEYLAVLCPPQEVANRAAALQEICQYFGIFAQTASRERLPLSPSTAK
jgi:hypothetical protein